MVSLALLIWANWANSLEYLILPIAHTDRKMAFRILVEAATLAVALTFFYLILTSLL